MVRPGLLDHRHLVRRRCTRARKLFPTRLQHFTAGTGRRRHRPAVRHSDASDGNLVPHFPCLCHLCHAGICLIEVRVARSLAER